MTQEEIKKIVEDMEFNLSTAKEELIKVIDKFNWHETGCPFLSKKIDVMEEFISTMEECCLIYGWNKERYNNDSTMLLDLKKRSDFARENFSKQVISIYNNHHIK